MCILGDGKIRIPSGAKLRVETLLSVAPTASIEFSGTGTPPGNSETTDDLTMDGTFRVIGSAGGKITTPDKNSSDRITISSTGVISSAEDALTINVEIINHGRITADGRDAGYDIKFTRESIHPASSGLFEVVTCDARMIFDLTSALPFTGPANFNCEAGTLEFKSDVTTADSEDGGGLRVVLGTVKVAQDISVRFRGKYTG